MWWLDGPTLEIRRPAITPSHPWRPAEEHRGPVPVRPAPAPRPAPRREPKSRREPLKDHLTDQQREVNKTLAETEWGHETEIARLVHDVESLEKTVREQKQNATELQSELDSVLRQHASLDSQFKQTEQALSDQRARSESQQARAETEHARAEAEHARAESEHARAESEHARAERLAGQCKTADQRVQSLEASLASQASEIRRVTAALVQTESSASEQLADADYQHAVQIRRLNWLCGRARKLAEDRGTRLRHWQEHFQRRTDADAARIQSLEKECVAIREHFEQTLAASKNDVESGLRLAEQLRIDGKRAADLASEKYNQLQRALEQERHQHRIAESKWQIEQDLLRAHLDSIQARHAEAAEAASQRLETADASVDRLSAEAIKYRARWQIEQQLAQAIQDEAYRQHSRRFRLAADTAKLAVEIEVISAQRDSISGRLDAADSRNDRILAERDHAMGQRDELAARVKQIHETNVAITLRCNQLQWTISELNESVAAGHTQIVQAEHRETSIRQTCQALRERLAEADKLVDQQTLRVASFDSELRRRIDQLDTLTRTSKRKLEEKNRNIEQLGGAIEQSAGQLAATLEASEKASEKAAKRIEALEATQQQTRQQQDRLVEVHQRQYASIQAQLDQSISDLDEERELRASAENEIRRLNLQHCDKLAFLSSKRNELTGVIERMKAENSELETELERIRPIAQHSGIVETEKARLKAQLAAGQSRGRLLIERYREQVESQKTTINRLRAEVIILSARKEKSERDGSRKAA